MSTWVKFCGCTSWADVEMAIEAGADAVGLIFAPSPRRISDGAAAEIARKIPAATQPVAVFVNPAGDEVANVRNLFPQALLQFSGSESPALMDGVADRAIKALHVDAQDDPSAIAAACEQFTRETILFDARREGLAGGTGATFPWNLVEPVARRRRVIVAGGLCPDNVGDCVRAIRPFGVDVRTGIETAGRKDPDKMRAFVRAVRAADEA